MKKNENKRKINEFQGKFSPSVQRKKNYYNKYLLKDYEKKKIFISLKKPNAELIISEENKNLFNTSNHKRIKSNQKNFIRAIDNKKMNLNKSTSELSFFRDNELKNKNTKKNSCFVNRNKKYNNNFNENNLKNLLSIDFSLKEFRNKIMNSFFHTNLSGEKNKNKRKIINLKNNNLKFNLNKSYNKEETRNTTSISGSNNTNIISNKNAYEKEEKNIKSPKHIINKRKSNDQLFSLKSSSTKKITRTYKIVPKQKALPKCNLYSLSNKKNKINANKKNKQLIKKNNLILAKKTYQSNHKYLSKEGNSNNFVLFNQNSGLENYTFNYLESYREKNNLSNCSSVIINKNMNVKYKNKSKSKKNKKKVRESSYKERISCNYSFKEFKSVEEIHFLYVYINQKKSEFFEKNNFVNI